VPPICERWREVGQRTLKKPNTVGRILVVLASWGVVGHKASVLEVVDLEAKSLQTKGVLAVVPDDSADRVRRNPPGNDRLHLS
jgi:hypothetical protein